MWEADTGQLVCVDIHTRNVGQLEWALEGPELRGVPCRGRVELCPCWAVDSSGAFLLLVTGEEELSRGGGTTFVPRPCHRAARRLSGNRWSAGPSGRPGPGVVVQEALVWLAPVQKLLGQCPEGTLTLPAGFKSAFAHQLLAAQLTFWTQSPNISSPQPVERKVCLISHQMLLLRPLSES